MTFFPFKLKTGVVVKLTELSGRDAAKTVPCRESIQWTPFTPGPYLVPVTRWCK